MQDLYIEATDKTPLVKCLYSSGTVAISGRSLPEDAARFWFPVIQWISDYYRNPQEDTFVILNLEYLNSASSSMLHKLFFALERLERFEKSDVHCQWCVDEDDDQYELAQDIGNFFTRVPIDIVFDERFQTLTTPAALAAMSMA